MLPCLPTSSLPSRRVCCHYQLPNNVVAAPDIVATTANLNHRHFETADLLELPTFRTPDVKITAEMSPDLMNPDVKQLTPRGDFSKILVHKHQTLAKCQ